MTTLAPTSTVRLGSLPGALTLVSYELPAGLAFEEWEEIGATLRAAGRAVQWWLGDWLRYGERAYGEKYAQAIDETGYDYQTLADMAYVSGKVEISRRRENLSWSHHREVASLPPEQQDAVLNAAEAMSLNREQVRAKVASVKGRPTLHRMTFELDDRAVAALNAICRRDSCDDEEAVTRALVAYAEKEAA